ncbi:hypothetical protein [Bacillus safensis]|uniref:hypothetical protein n=1 Tax=Bacillus safensis TaxID=561879 RepID=UPI00148EE6CA|nr:hypothetical protein [Bacillus safensis]NOL36764.1 hypothetical protein [Bacillus safensis]
MGKLIIEYDGSYDLLENVATYGLAVGKDVQPFWDSKVYKLTLSEKPTVSIKVLDTNGEVTRELKGVQLKLQENEERQKVVDKVIELVNKLN